MVKRLNTIEPKWLLVTAFFIAGIFLGGLGIYILFGGLGISTGFKINLSTSRYKHINPLLAVELFQNQQFSQNEALKLELQNLINNNQKNQNISSASIYFRDLNSGVWSGISEDNNFSPGKLLKIPIMITYFKLAESNPSILEESIVFKGEQKPEEIFGPKEPLIIGEAYSVNELIQRMIIKSDDQAADVLFDNVDRASLNEVFSDLGINFKEDKETQDFISLKLYSLFFRVLYNATYLNREFSERALGLLLEAPDKEVGLFLDLPRNIEISNRFGARSFVSSGLKLFEFYECGIVYYPAHPYLLCVASKGQNLNSLNNFFKQVGLFVYKEIDFTYHR